MNTLSVPKNNLSEALRAKIDAWLKRYPAEQKRSGVLQALMFAQEENSGFLTENIMNAVADYLEIPRIQVFEVASFYSMYNLTPQGRFIIDVCTNISCMLRGSNEVLAHFKRRLNIQLNETTADQKFTLREAECLAACVGAPMCQINKKYYEHLTEEKIDTILASLE